MANCKWLVDEICVNDKCPMCADYCPVVNSPGVCKYEAINTCFINTCFKDFEIRPTEYLDGHTEPNKFDVVKWYKQDKPTEVTNWHTGKKEIRDTFCYSIAHIWWNEKEPCWEFKSVGTRFLEDCEDGLCKFILEWMEQNEPDEE